MRKLSVLLKDKQISYFKTWCDYYLRQPEAVAYLIIQMAGFKKFINDLIIACDIDDILSNKLSPSISKKILLDSELLTDIRLDSNILSKYMFMPKQIYEFEYQFSKKYKCNRCGHPCDFEEIQIRRADEESDIFLFCGNCGLQQKRYM